MSKTKVTVNTIKIDIKGGVEEILEKTGKDCAELIKQKSPRITGDYADGWTYQMEKNNDTVAIYNDGPDKTLTHLLELGHRTKLGKKYGKQKRKKQRKKKTSSVRSKKGRKTTVAPQEHIRPAYNVIKEEYLENLKRIKMKVKK